MATDGKLGATELLFRCAKQMGLRPKWVAIGDLFVVTTADGEKYISVAYSSSNSQVSVSLARNKYFTRLILERYGLPNIPFARPQTLEQAKIFLDQHVKIIAKPVRGLGAQDIHIVSDMSDLDGLSIQKYILEKYIAGKEMRYLILNNKVIAVHESEYGTSVEETRELQRISYCADDWDADLIDLSLRIANILGLKFAAVDYLVDAQGNAHILEVNSTPGLKWFHAPTSGPPVDVAALFLEAMLEDGRGQVTQPAQGRELGAIPSGAYN